MDEISPSHTRLLSHISKVSTYMYMYTQKYEEEKFAKIQGSTDIFQSVHTNYSMSTVADLTAVCGIILLSSE